MYDKAFRCYLKICNGCLVFQNSFRTAMTRTAWLSVLPSFGMCGFRGWTHSVLPNLANVHLRVLAMMSNSGAVRVGLSSPFYQYSALSEFMTVFIWCVLYCVILLFVSLMTSVVKHLSYFYFVIKVASSVNWLFISLLL